MNWKNPEVKWEGEFRILSCEKCDKKLDVRSYFHPMQKNRVHSINSTGKPWVRESFGMEVHVRCINDNCEKSDDKKNPDYYKPVFVGAI